jgi:aminopeptidase YwaD
MVHKRSLLALLLSITLIATSTPTFAQDARTREPEILERNVRAELGFLASDAMQGRGSATNYERVAAEYVGSMFRQFGLEPGGDADATNTRGFVQRVQLETARFISAPNVTAGGKTWQYGKDFLVTGIRVPRLSGALQIIEGEAVAAKGSIALIRLPENADLQQRQSRVRAARSAQAAAVVLLETEANRRQRETGARLPNVSARIVGEEQTPSFAMLSFRKEAFDELTAFGNGTRIEFAGEIQADAAAATWNAVGVLRGSDPSGEAIMLSAHLDHLGTNETLTGDTIFNGADDDASGCVAVIELARALSAGKQPRRTIYFVCFGSEERGGHGARYFIDHTPVPLEKIVADVQFEMLGRPDAKIPPNTLWLTGYERSTLGAELARQGARLVADPHPEQNFFQRSDNYTLALRGVVAHTVSSFGLHTDYHRVTDDLSKVDFQFMTRSIDSMIAPIRWLANSTFRPAWLPGQQPVRN